MKSICYEKQPFFRLIGRIRATFPDCMADNRGFCRINGWISGTVTEKSIDFGPVPLGNGQKFRTVF